MLSKLIKPVAIVAVGGVLLGFLLFGTDFLSYLRTSTRVVQKAAQDQLSVDFEIQRARDMVEEILPQLQAHVQLIAEDEVEIATLEREIETDRTTLETRRDRLAELRRQMEVQQVTYLVGHREHSRQSLTEKLAADFARYREAELLLQSKEALLATRRQSLQNALRMLDRAKHQKLELEQKIESLVAQHRLLQSDSMGTSAALDHSSLARADQLLADIQRRLDVSERVLAHESDLRELELEPAPLNESSLLTEFDDYFTDASPVGLVANP